ncbi:MAG TPA: hypothetical protein PK605_11410 [Ignavibacteria bacterium]|nr:hypothetical protein [Ignavibacteria bacterium]HAX47962.1 hypothetical protein [Bacteroidota bacterium]HRE10309.1 hypothetical protein [Ignavibacteria bacterium]HRF67068.1 hypothetical protein [Ignavibacteria bacterium]HRJ05000.1 hypothetical protein [Ignavibacteria bacterium]
MTLSFDMENTGESSERQDWTVLCETYDYMESELIEALLRDREIQYETKNKADTLSDELGSRIIGKASTGIPILIYVKSSDETRAIAMLNEDWSHLLDGEDPDFGNTEDDSIKPG